MDDQNKNGDLLPPAVEVLESKEEPQPAKESNEEPLRDIVAILRTEVENQAKTIDSLSKSMAMYDVERIHNHNYVAFLQAELHHLARHVANHHMEANFEALRHEVSSELGYLRRTAMSQSSNQGVSCSNSYKSSDIQKDSAIFRLTQELYHSRNVLWEQVTELRAEIHHIHGQLRNQRTEMQRKLSERLNKDMHLEKLMDTYQAQERLLSLDISEIQTKLEAVRISKDKARQKTGGTGAPPGAKATPYNSDSDETQSGTQMKGNIPKTKEKVNVCARRK